MASSTHRAVPERIRREHGAEVVGVPGEHQLHVFQPYARLPAELQIHRVRAEYEPLDLAVTEADVEPCEELTARATSGAMSGSPPSKAAPPVLVNQTRV